jgi:hypothetical protein
MKHLPEEVILRFLDGELPEREAEEAAQHLRECWSCRARANDLEGAIAGFVRYKQEELDGEAPKPVLGAQLRKRPKGHAKWWGLGLAVGLAALTIYGINGGPRPEYLPNPELTPGATRLISLEQVCALGEGENQQPDAKLAMEVFRGYGIGSPGKGLYEVDYLIDPRLGGAEDVRNLWPQPFQEGKWNSRVKDALEERLREKVCRGEMDLAAAQEEVAKDWVAAYRRHFRTREPIAAHALFVKDKPWEQ